jgi:signal transduction histidine kinase
LNLSKKFVELLGGKIWVESEVGKGSTFTFSIPIDVSKTQSQSTTGEKDAWGGKL